MGLGWIVDGVGIGSADAAAEAESTFMLAAITCWRAIARMCIGLGGNREAIPKQVTNRFVRMSAMTEGQSRKIVA